MLVYSGKDDKQRLALAQQEFIRRAEPFTKLAAKALTIGYRGFILDGKEITPIYTPESERQVDEIQGHIHTLYEMTMAEFADPFSRSLNAVEDGE